MRQTVQHTVAMQNMFQFFHRLETANVDMTDDQVGRIDEFLHEFSDEIITSASEAAAAKAEAEAAPATESEPKREIEKKKAVAKKRRR